MRLQDVKKGDSFVEIALSTSIVLKALQDAREVGLRGFLARRRARRRIRRILDTCGCVAYCPGCRDPLNDQATWREDDDGRGVYGCSRCGRDSEWHFGIAPGPVLMVPDMSITHEV